MIDTDKHGDFMINDNKYTDSMFKTEKLQI